MSTPPTSTFGTYSDSPRNVNRYLGQDYRFAPCYLRSRDPATPQNASNDTRPKENQGKYPLGSLWLNTANRNMWLLVSLQAGGGKNLAEWTLISQGLTTGPVLSLSDSTNTLVFPSTAAGFIGNIQLTAGSGISVVSTPGSNLLTISNTGSGTETLTGDDGVAVSPSGGGTINVVGSVVANATNAKAVYVANTSANTETWEVQLSAAIASTAVAKVGLAAFSSAQFAVDGNGFVTLSGGSGAPTLGIVPDAHTAPGTTPVVPNGSGNIILEGGATFATGTQAHPIRTNSLAANTVDLQIQLAGSNAATSTANNFGVSQFDSNSFTVSSGFVTISNAGTAGPVTTLTGNSGGAISPSSGNINTVGTGSVTIVGSGNTLTTELTGLTQYDMLVGQGSTTIGLVVPSATSGVPLISQGSAAYPVFGTAVVAGGGTGDTSFTAYSVITGGTTSTGALQNVSGVGTSGQVLTSNGAAALPTWQAASAGNGITAIAVDALTGGGTNPVVASAGQVSIIGGATFATGSRANPIEVVSTAANTASLQIQLAGSNAGSAATNDFGVAQFNSNNFNVSSGFVTASNFTINTGSGLSGGGTITLGGSLTLTATAVSFSWTDQSTSFSAAVNNGYFCTALLTATLPSSPAQGNEIQFVATSAGALTIQAAGSQKIRLGNTITAGGGTAVNTAIGAAMTLTYRLSDTTWYANASTGNWILT